MADINARCSVAFIAVPTPGNPDCSLDMSIVEGVVRDCTAPLIVIRSTLQPGTCDCLEETYGKNICMVPEYLGETVAHPLLDETQRKFLVIGGRPSNRRKLIELYQSVYNANVTIRQVSNLEAEVIKLSENRAIAFKVMQSHELFLACEAAGVDYYVIREAVYGDDPRFDLWFTFAKEGNLGFDSSKCLQKDVPAWAAWAESVGGSAEITEMLVKKSREYARSGEAPYTCDNRPSGEEV
jgi:UDP-glucose 6-dehydrogenase